MITTKQKWILGGLASMSAAVWVPQLAGGGSETTESQVGLDGPTEAEMLEMDAEFDEMFVDDAGGGPGDERGTKRDPSKVDGADEIVGSILGALGTSDVFSSEARHQTLEGLAADWARESGEMGVVTRTPLAAFLDDNPLLGTMTGDTNRVAMFGSYMMRVGDVIPGSPAFITKIERNNVVIENDGSTVEIPLPPLRASDRYARRRIAPGGGPVSAAGDAETMITPEGENL